MNPILAKTGPLATALLLLSAARLPAQNLPPAPPTSVPTQTAAPEKPPTPPSNRARVDYSGQLLTITADNSSLNQILRDISHLTGMIITGGVADERVFGTYGPADPSAVLTTLLNGTGSNMLLSLDAQRTPRELILTPRQGGPTPPNPNAVRDDNRFNDLPPQQNTHMFNRDNPYQQRLQQQPPSPPTAAPTPAATTTDSTTPQSTNGVKTPQQIYEELMKMHQKPTPPPL